MKKKINQKPIQRQQTNEYVTIREKICNVCMKRSTKIDKPFACKICRAPIHKKCLGLRLSDIRNS